MRNKYPGTCKDCGQHVAAGEGHFQRIPGRGWAVRHASCVAVAKQSSGKSLSKAQLAALNADLHDEAMDLAFPAGSENDIGGW